MPRFGIGQIRQLLAELPNYGKLAYCLLRDERVPAGKKAAFVGALAAIYGPLDFPAWVPVLGQVDEIAFTVLAVRVFIESCPAEVVSELEGRIEAGESVFDADLGTLREHAAVYGGRARGWYERVRGEIDTRRNRTEAS